jgi:hypothetical protein
MRGYVTSLTVLLFLSAGPVFAAVFINEIAWMGSVEGDANSEWIELYNDAPVAVDLSGWKLQAADGTPSIALSGTISANGYFLLERADDAVSGVKADIVYTGGMENAGEILTLRDSKEVEIDRVDSGVNWKMIGGNNETKQTAQRSGTTWITAVATARAANAVPEPVVESPKPVVHEKVLTKTEAVMEELPPGLQKDSPISAEKAEGVSIWYFIGGVVILVGLGIGGSFLVKSEPKNEIDEYTIIEEKDDAI